MKAEILKIAGVKSEKEFYKKFPTEEAFQKAHGKEFKKAKLGKAIAPKAQKGHMVGEKKGSIIAAGGSPLYDLGRKLCGAAPLEQSSKEGKYVYEAPMSNEPIGWSELQTYNEDINPKSKDFKGQLKMLQAQFPNLTKEQLLAAGADSARIKGRVSDLSTWDKPENQTYDRAWYPYYRELMQPNTPVTVPQILEFQSKQPGGLAGYQQVVESNYGKKKKAKHGGEFKQLTDFSNPPKAQNGWENCGEDQYWDGVRCIDINPQTSGNTTTSTQDENFEYQEVPKFQVNQTLSTGTPKTGPGTGVNPSAAVAKSNNDFMKSIGGAAGLATAAVSLYGGIQGLQQEKKQRKKAEAAAKVSDITLMASKTRPEPIKRQYLRPEDQIVQPNQMFPTYGVGTNYLAKDGAVVMKIGGNLTEIQNTYAPNNLYDDLGYEPLDESGQVKQYMHGGFTRAQSGISQFSSAGGQDLITKGIGAAFGGDNAGGNIGKTVGSTAGTLIGGPVGGMIGGAIGQIAGNYLDPNTKAIKRANEKTKRNLEKAAFQSGSQALQNQYSAYVRNGGDIPQQEEGGWVSHDWQPQVITQFGEHSMRDLLREDPTMNTLRTGGHITQNNMFPTDQYALGGELKTTWGGYAEPISYNPYMPGSGETVMFRGKSHEEGDGKGHTGIGVKYGDGGKMTDYAEFGSRDADADVEVERGEPATEMVDGETGEKNMVVFGNLKIPNMFLDQIGDVKAKGKKFKNYVADLGKDEAKQNKIIEKATDKLDNLDVYTPFDKLKMDSLQATIMGANMKLKESALKKSNAAAVQNAINDTAAEHGIDADHLAKGKIKIDKEAMKQQAKYGKELLKAQTGVKYPVYDGDGKISYYVDEKGNRIGGGSTATKKSTTSSKKNSPKPDSDEWYAKVRKSPAPEPVVSPDGSKTFTNPDGSYYVIDKGNTVRKQYSKSGVLKSTENLKFKKDVIGGSDSRVKAPVPYTDPTSDSTSATTSTKTTKPNKWSKWVGVANQALEYLRPSDQEDFDYSQVYPEMMALSMNQLEPVQAQLYRPELGTPYDISLQDQMNANQADFNAIQRQSGYAPEALATLAAQKYAANSKVLGEQFRLNQAEKARVYEGNRNILNDAKLKNLGILDTQMVRQEEAKSRTKQQAIEAMKSVADKIAKNKLENRTLGIYENLYKYRFDPTGRAINMNPLAQFTATVGSEKTGGLPPLPGDYEWDTTPRPVKKKKAADESRNGNIVKAIKNL